MGNVGIAGFNPWSAPSIITESIFLAELATIACPERIQCSHGLPLAITSHATRIDSWSINRLLRVTIMILFTRYQNEMIPEKGCVLHTHYDKVSR